MSKLDVARAWIGPVLALVAAGALGGCAATSTATNTAITTTQPAPPVAEPAAAPRPIAASRGQTAPPPPPPPAEEPAEPYTVEKARSECWTKLDGDKKAPRDLEKRIPLVQKCVAEKMAAQPQQ